MWQNQVFKRINNKLKLHNQEHEEMQLLKLKIENLRIFRKKLLKQKYD